MELAHALTGMEINAVSVLVRSRDAGKRQENYLRSKRRSPLDFSISERGARAWRLTRGVATMPDRSNAIITNHPQSKVAAPNTDVEFEVGAPADDSSFQ